MKFLDRLKDDVVFLRGAFRALKMTTPIARHPNRVFPVVIEELADREITGGCGVNIFCPSSPNTRGQMAVFLTKTFGLN